jgi:multiple sugar transport system permease protein
MGIARAHQMSVRFLSTTRAKRLLFIWGSLTPIMLYFLIFSVLPIFAALYISLHKWPLLGRAKPFVGLDNYISVINDPRFWISLKNTLYYAAAYMFLVIILGLAMALLVSSLHPTARSVFRPLFFAPQVTSAVAVALMFSWLYQPQWGVLNYLLRFIGLGPFMWLQSSKQVMPAIIITGVWEAVGYSMVIYTAGLTNIPTDLKEAGAVDGATSGQVFWHIVLPLLQPTTLFMFVTSMIGGLQVFTEVWLMSGGGPGTASRVLVLEIYDQGFRYFEMGRASSIAFYLFLLIAVIAYLQIRYLREQFEF